MIRVISDVFWWKHVTDVVISDAILVEDVSKETQQRHVLSLHVSDDPISDPVLATSVSD
jgi:hypothetical protein